MKKLVCFLMIAACIILSSCNKLPKDIQLNEKLCAYAEFSEEHDTLWGVKTTAGEVIIHPQLFRNFAADDKVITCLNPENNKTFAYLTSGEPIGAFEIFTHWTENGDYYLGVQFKNRTYYFTKTGEIVRATDEYAGLQYLFLEVGDNCEVYTYDGFHVWSIPKDAVVFKEEKSKESEEYYIVAPENWNKPPYPLYNIEGKLIKKITLKQYKRLLNRSSAIKALSTQAFESAPNILK